MSTKPDQSSCVECKSTQGHKFSCHSWYTEPAHAKIADGLYLGWFGARCLPRWAAVVTLETPERVATLLTSYQCQGRHTGIVPAETPVHQVNHPDREPGLTGHLATTFDFIDEWRPKGDVYLHCHAAISRSPFTMALYLADRVGWDFAAARAHVKHRRRVVDIWEPFIAEGEAFLRHWAAIRAGTLPVDAIYLPPTLTGWIP